MAKRLTVDNTIVSGISQEGLSVLFKIMGLLVVLPLFLFIISTNNAIEIKLFLTLYLGLFPVFIFKPRLFLYFIFLLTPALRILAKNEIIFQNDSLSINFNFIINLSILFFGAFFLISKKSEIKRIIKGNLFVRYFLFFTLLAVLSVSYSIDRMATVEESVRLLGIVIIFFFARLIIKNRKDFLSLLAVMIFGTLIPVSLALFQFFNGSGWWDKTIMKYRIQGTFLHPATLAFYLLLFLPLLWALLKNSRPKIIKASFFLVLVFFSLLILATLARVAWLGALGMLLVYGAIMNRKALILTFLMLFACYLAIPTINSRINDVFAPKFNSSLNTRFKIYNSTLPAFFESPVLGQGFGSFEQIHLRLNGEARTYESLQAHNDYLRLLIELGLVGLSLYLAIFGALIFTAYKHYKKSDAEMKSYLFGLILLVLGALAISAGDNVLRTMEVQYLLWAIIGATFAFLEIKKATL